MFVGTF